MSWKGTNEVVFACLGRSIKFESLTLPFLQQLSRVKDAIGLG